MIGMPENLAGPVDARELASDEPAHNLNAGMSLEELLNTTRLVGQLSRTM
jgi:hypothetical protein